eukprot:3746207-Rhodomonas_salina.2
MLGQYRASRSRTVGRQRPHTLGQYQGGRAIREEHSRSQYQAPHSSGAQPRRSIACVSTGHLVADP